ncbi:MAG: hypothetical protein P1P84_04690 [Deferrisomatales bacterium]|nr:hypothetical protein [Deferrisomatales bacterium]
MTNARGTCPLTGNAVLDRYFLENRARLLEIAAFLDRMDRAREAEAGRADFRYREFREALRLVLEGDRDRTAAVLSHLSDATAEPRESAAGLKGASGAWGGRQDP